MARGDLPDFSTRVARLLTGKRKQGPHFIEAETKLTCPTHEGQAANVLDIVKPIP